MEKKGNRNAQSSTRGLAVTDLKKNQDVSGKAWPRGSRRREPPSAALGSKAEPSRKPAPQRAKTLDKRPKPRGTYYTGSGAVGRAEAPQLNEADDAELGSVFLPGSKKQSLNHLLNFVYSTPREGHVASDRGGAAGGGKMTASKMMVTKKHKYNKEHFLQANCQFIVQESGDYKQYMNNPDALVDWNLIEQVNVQVSEFPACPICLFSPVAGKMTKCGHIYCWSCILHYLALSDKTYRKCPICYESVHKQDLKSVVAIPHQTFNVNETITFKLMKRPRGSLIAYPIDFETKDENVMFTMSETDAGDIHSKLLTANRNEIMSIIDRENAELVVQMSEDENAPERCFIEEAIGLLENRVQQVLAKTHEAKASVAESVAETAALEKLEQCSLNDCDTDNNDSVIENDINNVNSNIQPSKFYYFYQASDGQHIYLHAINARMLEHTYGSLEFGPKTLSGKILEKEGGSMTEELRKRLRCLQHLPVTCQFEVAEIQLRQPTVNRDTLEHFQEQIEVRKKRRQRRAKEEKRREKRIAEEENRQMGKYPVANIHLESYQQFPGFESRARCESETTQLSEADSYSEASSPANFGSLPNENACWGPSFATMLSTEKKQKPPSWPNLLSSSSSSREDAPKLINVTGRRMTSQKAANGDDSDCDLEGFEPIQSLNRNLGDAIMQALQNVDIVEEDFPSSSGKKKKKKKNQKVLFTTNVAISGNKY
ncbi:unnamed protein product [Brassicogethes aeneus]|uniref:E3 ubiquitin-protein ligase RNF10 n=1 Tax=Brassicogethes aeneus TaxID=1431903 RepID=A0A9P0B509_BRAAE|nr:unnamed protein product [Brassicogethes aeneus]